MMFLAVSLLVIAAFSLGLWIGYAAGRPVEV